MREKQYRVWAAREGHCTLRQKESSPEMSLRLDGDETYLSRNQAQNLLHALKYFIDTGKIP